MFSCLFCLLSFTFFGVMYCDVIKKSYLQYFYHLHHSKRVAVLCASFTVAPFVLIPRLPVQRCHSGMLSRGNTRDGNENDIFQISFGLGLGIKVVYERCTLNMNIYCALVCCFCFSQ